MTDRQFEKFCKLIYDELGNVIKDEKRKTLEIKIEKIIHKYHPELKTVDKYYDELIKANKKDRIWEIFVDNITVHKTNFFREKEHFDYISENMTNIVNSIPRIKEKNEIRVWCAATSTGEEVYTLYIVLKECLPPGCKIKFLATDISEKVLTKAIKGRYSALSVECLNTNIKSRYFYKVGDEYQVKQDVIESITFRKMNLLDDFKFQNKFDIIFCRNVMIYFDDVIRNKILDKIYDVLIDKGLLFLGISESLSGRNSKFDFIKLSIYTK